MADKYLYVEYSMPMKSQMMRIAKLCQVSMDTAFAAWFRLWCWFDTTTPDGKLRFLTPGMCDDIGLVPGLGAALVEVGWVKFTDDGGVVCYWNRHFGVTARKRAARNRRLELNEVRRAERIGNTQNVK